MSSKTHGYDEACKALACGEALLKAIGALEHASTDDILVGAAKQLGAETAIVVRRLRNVRKWLEPAS